MRLPRTPAEHRMLIFGVLDGAAVGLLIAYLYKWLTP